MEKRWRAACQRQDKDVGEGGESSGSSVLPLLPTDEELGSAFSERRKRFVRCSSFLSVVLSVFKF